MTNLATQIRAAVEGDKHTHYTELLLQAADLLDHKDTQINTRPAVPVEGLEIIGYVHRGTAGLLMEGGVSKAVLVQKPGGDFKHPVVFAEQAEAIIAAERARAAEKERLRFEGDLDKWMKTIGAGITGYQPEAYALMDLACQELVTLRADNAALTARVKELETANAKLCDGAIDYELKIAERDVSLQALETQLAAAEKIAFEHGYVLACCNIVNLHDEPTIAHDALSELGVTRQAVKAMNLSEFDMKALRKIERGSAGSPYAKANRKASAALEAQP